MLRNRLPLELLRLRQIAAEARGNNTMQRTEYVYWQENEMWLGFLEEYPDYRTQGETRQELEKNLRDVYSELTSSNIPSVRRIDQLEAA